MSSTKGTPRTLEEAIENGIEEFKRVGRPDQEAYFVRIHVRDFLAQKFSIAVLKSRDLGGDAMLLELMDEIDKQAV